MAEGALPGAWSWPDPLGLCLGLLSVAVGQLCVAVYHFVHLHFGRPTPIQKEGMQQYNFVEGLWTHLAQVEGFVLLGSYLSGTWMFRLMPPSYYVLEGNVNPWHVAAQLLIMDCVQTFAHLAEHKVSAEVYKASHKPHHRFLNPRLFDAFNGSLTDTVCMILVPLYVTALLVPANVWSYMAFGTIYSSWLTLIHAEYSHPWDPFFRKIGFGTAGDHHVHHKVFIKNYGHLFMYWDKMLGTYKSPLDVDKFRKDI